MATEDYLFHTVRASLCVCVVGAQERDVLTLSIKQHVFNFHDRTVKTHGRRSPKEERTGVRHGSFSRKVIFLVDSQSVLPEMPFSGLANHV